MTQVWILKATTAADFDEPEHIGVGISQAAVETWFTNVLKESWKAMDKDSQDFYQDDFEDYEGSWRTDTWIMDLAE